MSEKVNAPQSSDSAGEVILDVRNVRKYFPVRGGFWRRVVNTVKAVDGVSFAVRRGETLGIVGESGCGKTTLGRTIMRLIEPTSGEAYFLSRQSGTPQRVNLFALDQKALKPIRRELQMIYQDPFSSLDPRQTVGRILEEPFIIHKIGNKSERQDRVAELLKSVGLRPDYASRYPHQFSGGQRQRIGIARALALRPQLVIADEPVSALDVSVQAQVLNLLVELQSVFNLTYIFIAHNLSVVQHISDRVVVMYLGRVVEVGSSESLYEKPYHPYTEALLSAMPVADPDVKRKPIILEGNVPSPINPPSGCAFHPRCRYAQGKRLQKCQTEIPELRTVGRDEDGQDRMVACHFADELDLRGAFDEDVDYRAS